MPEFLPPPPICKKGDFPEYAPRPLPFGILDHFFVGPPSQAGKGNTIYAPPKGKCGSANWGSGFSALNSTLSLHLVTLNPGHSFFSAKKKMSASCGCLTAALGDSRPLTEKNIAKTEYIGSGAPRWNPLAVFLCFYSVHGRGAPGPSFP